jgi:hypothetical protein
MQGSRDDGVVVANGLGRLVCPDFGATLIAEAIYKALTWVRCG